MPRQFIETYDWDDLRYMHSPSTHAITIKNILSAAAKNYVDALDLVNIQKEVRGNFPHIRKSHRLQIDFFNKRPVTKELESILPPAPGRDAFISESVGIAEKYKRHALGDTGSFIIRQPLKISFIHKDGPSTPFRGLGTVCGMGMYVFDDDFFTELSRKYRGVPDFDKYAAYGTPVEENAMMVWERTRLPHAIPTRTVTTKLRAQIRFD